MSSRDDDRSDGRASTDEYEDAMSNSYHSAHNGDSVDAEGFVGMSRRSRRELDIMNALHNTGYVKLSGTYDQEALTGLCLQCPI